MAFNPEAFNQQVFCAALTGIIASPEFHGPIYQQHPRAAVMFAVDVVRALKECPDWNAPRAEGPR